MDGDDVGGGVDGTEDGRHDGSDGHTGPAPLRASFHTVVLVCRDCERRGNGPPKLRSKSVRKTLKEASRGARGQIRVVASSCLGPCPKKSMTVATLSGEAPPSLLALRGSDDVEAVSRRWPRRGAPGE